MSSEATIQRLFIAADAAGEDWLEAMVIAAYAVIDAQSADTLDEAILDLGALLPVREE